MFESTLVALLLERINSLENTVDAYKEALADARKTGQVAELRADNARLQRKVEWYKKCCDHIARTAEAAGILVVYPDGNPIE